MKNLFLTLVTILTTTILFSQDNIWVKIPNYESKTTEVSQSLSGLKITEIKQALPASRNQELREVYQITCNCDVNELLQLTSKNPLFVKPEIGPQYQTLEVPNDYQLLSYDWALNSIKATEAWDITHGDTSIVIAITDANYYQYHEELAMKVDWITPNNTNTNYGHGTAVASLAAGNTNNGCGKSSIGWKSHLQLRMMDYNQILEATYSGAKVINCSWASSCYYNTYAQMVIDEAYNNGSTIIASAGNGSTCSGASNLVYPASYNHVISVSSVGPQDNHERFIGNPSSTHQHNSMVDIVAPGYDVFLTTAPGQYMTGTGTSFAAPLVSGTVALMLSVNKCLTPDQIELILKQSADSSIYNYNASYIGQLGSGKLNAQRAVEMAKRFNTFDAQIKTSVICYQNFKQATIENLSGQSPFSYVWSNGQMSDKITIDTTSNYWVEIVDANGCRFFTEQMITKYNAIEIQSDITHVTCNGMQNGNINVVATGGEGQLTYLWSNEMTTQQVSGLKSKDYSVVVTDEKTCNKFESFTITEPTKLETSISYVQPTTTQLGSIDITTTGGVEPYEYMWNHGETSEDLLSVVADFYEVLITDANGCMSSENVILNQSIDVVDVTGINEISKEDVVVYPNPSNGLINIEFNNINEFNLYDATGKLVNTFNGNKVTTTIETPGVYYLNWNNNVEKIIIK